jgi:hypothetical protein
MRFADMERNNFMSLHRVRPNLNTSQVMMLVDAIQSLRAQQVGGVSMTVTSELLQAD